MRRYLIAALLLSTLSLGSASPALAQAYRTAVGWTGGMLSTTSLNDGAGGGDLVDMKPDATWLLGIHYDHWLGSGNIGIRARVDYAKPTLPWIQGDREIRVYMGDLGLLLRPLAPGPGTTVLPFLGGGVGFINWGFGDGISTTFQDAGVTYAGEEKFQLVATASVGIDIITPWQWGEGPLVLRLEGRDHIQFSSSFDPANSEDAEFGTIHNAAVVIGFHTGIGVLGGGN